MRHTTAEVVDCQQLCQLENTALSLRSSPVDLRPTLITRHASASALYLNTPSAHVRQPGGSVTCSSYQVEPLRLTKNVSDTCVAKVTYQCNAPACQIMWSFDSPC